MAAKKKVGSAKDRRNKPSSAQNGGSPKAKLRTTKVRKTPAGSRVRKTILPKALSYEHKEAEVMLRPDVGTQSQFKKRKPPVQYRYDSSLSPSMEWDGQNWAREYGEWLLKLIEQAAILPNHKFEQAQELMNNKGEIVASIRTLQEAVDQLKRIGKPFLNWAGKAERLSFDVPTLPLFVHERLSTKAIIETLKSHRKDEGLVTGDLFADPRRPIVDQILKAYEYKDQWVNRLILGDSLVVMNSLLSYEGMGGQVQMIYMDPPYGIKFGSNFQPFVRKRDVDHNNDEDMTREPEMVRAYRDTWEVGLHSYLTYLRDRFVLSRELLAPTGSLFLQINDTNLDLVKRLLEEVFGTENFVAIIAVTKSAGGLESVSRIPTRLDYLLWFAKEKDKLPYVQLYEQRADDISAGFNHIELESGEQRPLTKDERGGTVSLPSNSKLFRPDSLTKPGPGAKYEIEVAGKTYDSGRRWWGTPKASLQKLIDVGRVKPFGNTLRYVKYLADFSFKPIGNLWDGLAGAKDPIYAVQTNEEIVQRCMLMSTKAGDLVLDPTCGSGTTAHVAEQWGRRWISVDVSRVPLALARQRLLTGTFEYYQLNDESRGPVSGFKYVQRQNKKGEEVGGIVPHITLESIANDEPIKEEVIVDRPEVERKVTRVSGPFCVEATIPTPAVWDQGENQENDSTNESSFIDRMLEVLRRSPVLHLGNNRSVNFKNVRRPAKTLTLTAEGLVDATAPGQNPTLEEAIDEADEKAGRILPFTGKPVAFVFGPENGAVSEKLVYEAAKEARGKNYTHLYVIGFSIQANANSLIDNCEQAMDIPATYVSATPDLIMGDLLKTMRSSQIFSVCARPDVILKKNQDKDGSVRYRVELRGLDSFDPVEMKPQHMKGNDVPAWFLDTDYNGLCFHVSQAFFPRTGAWENLKKALKATHDESVWDHLAGTESEPFVAGEHDQVAVKVIDDRGNELAVVVSLSEAVNG